MTIPTKKGKIFAYLVALLGESKSQKDKAKEDKRDYKNAEHWNLNSTFLDSLKSFLDKYFIK